MENQQQLENIARRKRTNRRTLIIVGSVLVVLFALSILGNLIGDEEAEAEEAQSAPATTQMAPPPAPVAPPTPATSSVPAPQSVSTTVAPPPPPAAASRYSNPRCEPASDTLVAMVAAGLTKDGYQLTNGTVITQGGTTYFGATMVDATGKMKQRSDVWVVRDGIVYSGTGGARNESLFPESDVIGIGPGDDPVAATDECVIDLTR